MHNAKVAPPRATPAPRAPQGDGHQRIPKGSLTHGGRGRDRRVRPDLSAKRDRRRGPAAPSPGAPPAAASRPGPPSRPAVPHAARPERERGSGAAPPPGG